MLMQIGPVLAYKTAGEATSKIVPNTGFLARCVIPRALPQTSLVGHGFLIPLFFTAHPRRMLALLSSVSTRNALWFRFQSFSNSAEVQEGVERHLPHGSPSARYM